MLSLSVALDPHKGIGKNGILPWHLKEELKLFKQNTLYKHIVMGRTTYEGLPGKLKDRYLVIVTNKKNYEVEEALIINDLKTFCQLHENDEEEYVICGGASIYKQAYPYCRKAYVSFILDEYDVDTTFDSFDLNDWIIEKEIKYEQFIYRELTKKEAPSAC